MTRDGQYRRYMGACVAAASLFVQTILLVLHLPLIAKPGAPVAQPGLIAFAGPLQSVLICSAHGTRSITLDAGGNPVEAPNAPDLPQHCPLCVTPAAFALAGVVPDDIVPPMTTVPRIRWVAPDPMPHGRAMALHRNRGPPGLLEA